MGATMTKDQVRAALGTPNHANETRSDFDDLMPSTARRRYVNIKDHTRIVAGADDLVHPMAGRSNGGVARSSAPVIPDMSHHAIKDDEDNTLAPRDLRSERQIEIMVSLLDQLEQLDHSVSLQARIYTAKMTDAGRWTPGRGGNASDWIGRMIAKVRELKFAPKAATASTCSNCDTSIRPDWCSVCRETTPEPVAAAPVAANVQHDELPIRQTKTHKPMPQYYAVEIDGVTKFYRVKAGTKPGWWWIEAQASDEFHPVRNVGMKNMILRAIIDQGPEECMRNYGRKINHCGRCHRTLTDATSRANGIGPECEGKL
jgi:hypothetical protein